MMYNLTKGLLLRRVVHMSWIDVKLLFDRFYWGDCLQIVCIYLNVISVYV